jgi:hypothetical protein
LPANARAVTPIDERRNIAHGAALSPQFSVAGIRNVPLFAIMNAWIEAARFASDSQRVVALRMIRLATGGPLAATEATQMISEKVAAFSEAQGAILATIATGGSLHRAASKAYAPYRRAVRANRRRLGA